MKQSAGAIYIREQESAREAQRQGPQGHRNQPVAPSPAEMLQQELAREVQATLQLLKQTGYPGGRVLQFDKSGRWCGDRRPHSEYAGWSIHSREIIKSDPEGGYTTEGVFLLDNGKLAHSSHGIVSFGKDTLYGHSSFGVVTDEELPISDLKSGLARLRAGIRAF